MQSWLLNNYTPLDSELEATLTITQVMMDPKETIQTFLNRFKTIIVDLTWNNTTVVTTLQIKLTPKLSKTIHLLRPHEWPKTFTNLKTVAQEADNYLRVSKRTHKDH